MRKNEVGRILRVIGILVIVAGTIGSIVLGFNTVQSPMDEIMGYMGQATVTYNFSQVIPRIFMSIILGVLLIGLSEMIFILDEYKENSKRLCLRFGIKPADFNKYNQAKRTMASGQNRNPGQNMNSNMNQNVNPNANKNMNPNMNPNMNHNAGVNQGQNTGNPSNMPNINPSNMNFDRNLRENSNRPQNTEKIHQNNHNEINQDMNRVSQDEMMKQRERQFENDQRRVNQSKKGPADLDFGDQDYGDE